jgi:hypothetical protein
MSARIISGDIESLGGYDREVISTKDRQGRRSEQTCRYECVGIHHSRDVGVLVNTVDQGDYSSWFKHK